jgi:peptidase E
MPSITKILSLLNFQDSYLITQRNELFNSELNWLIGKVGNPTQALFIPYAYTGSAYPDYFRQITDNFSPKGITITDINSGDPASLIAAARMIVIGGGDITALITKLNSLKTPAFDPYVAIKNRIANRVPYMGWNEGSAIVSPRYFTPPSTPLNSGVDASVFQIICNYTNNITNRNAIKNYLLNNLTVSKVICQVATLKSDKSGVRLEEDGNAMVDSATAPYPTVIRYKIVDGQLVES